VTNYFFQMTGCSINLLVSSSGSTLPVVLSMPNTADFCVLTARSLYSFYPVTTGHRVNLLLEICSGQPSTIKYMVSLKSYETTANWLEPCGEACPVVFRLTCGLKGVSVMRLTDHRKGEPDDFDPEGTFGWGCYSICGDWVLLAKIRCARIMLGQFCSLCKRTHGRIDMYIFVKLTKI